MTDFLVLGTDTDAGKTTFALLWLAAFSNHNGYWKPIETGDSDTESVRRLVPTATVHPPLARFTDPVAPPLAARREGRAVPSAAASAVRQLMDRACQPISWRKRRRRALLPGDGSRSNRPRNRYGVP